MTSCCPVCGRPFTFLEQVLSERDINFQCHRCWSRVRALGAKPVPRVAYPTRKGRGSPARRAA